MITEDQLALLDRKAKMLYDNHVGTLLSTGDALLSSIEPGRLVTVRDSINAFPIEVGKAMTEYGQALKTELLSTIETMRVTITESDRDAVLEIVRRYVHHELYLKRLQIHFDSIARKMSGHGGSAALARLRTDHTKASVEAGAMNGTRRIFASIKNDLDALVLANTAASGVTTKENISFLEEANKTIELKPNFMGLGINLNHVLARVFGRKKHNK